MSFESWADSKVNKMDWKDVALTKMSVAACILFIAKIWTPILSLDSYVYAIIFVIAALRPMYRVYFKKD